MGGRGSELPCLNYDGTDHVFGGAGKSKKLILAA